MYFILAGVAKEEDRMRTPAFYFLLKWAIWIFSNGKTSSFLIRNKTEHNTKKRRITQ